MGDLYVSYSLFRANSVLIVKQYGCKYKAIWCKSIARKGFEPLDDSSSSDSENTIIDYF